MVNLHRTALAEMDWRHLKYYAALEFPALFRPSGVRRQVNNSLRTTLPAGLRGMLPTMLMSRGCSKRETLSSK